MKLLIVDDHPMVRKGLAATLSTEGSFREIREASCVEEAVAILTSFRPDMAILDLKLGRQNGLDIVIQSRKKKLETKFLILTSSSRREDFQKALELDVDGFVLKEAYAEDVIYAVHSIARGRKFFDSVMTQYVRSQEDEPGGLTPRERDVLNELGKGLNNTEIANRLYISENTVKKHIGSIFCKLGLSCRVEAALYANNSMSLDNDSQSFIINREEM